MDQPIHHNRLGADSTTSGQQPHAQCDRSLIVVSEARISPAGIGQDSVSRLQQRSDPLISTLRGDFEVWGGRQSLIAEFPNQDPVVLAGLAAIE